MIVPELMIEGHTLPDGFVVENVQNGGTSGKVRLWGWNPDGRRDYRSVTKGVPIDARHPNPERHR